MLLQEQKTSVTRRLPPHVFFFVSAVFHYLGPSFAVLLFSSVSVLGVAWFRIASASVVFAVWRRPWGIFTKMPWAKQRTLLALARLPLGTVGGIEFLGPIALAALGARTHRNIAALLLAVGGVWLLTDVRFSGQPLGLLFAFANCAFFMLYIILGHRIAQDGSATGIDRLGAAMLIALITITPLELGGALPAMTQPLLILAGVGVGICSSVIPYVCDQVAMARLPQATFALLLSLLPASATVIGVVVLRQIPGILEIVGMLLVAGGVALHREVEALPGKQSEKMASAGERRTEAENRW